MLFLRGFVLKPTERAKVLFRNGTRDFQNSPPFERLAFFYVTVKILKVFSTLTLKQIFWEIKPIFKKLEYCLLFESTKTESASFPYKSTLSEANVKTNRRQ